MSDQAHALSDLEKAIRLAPSSFEVLRELGQVEATSGKWDEGLAHIRQAALLDPRSASTADRYSRVLLALRRYPDARAAAERGLAVSGEDLSLIEDRALSYAGQGDLAGARASLRAVPGTLDRAAVVANVSNYFDTYWMLDSADVALTHSLPAAAFDGDRSVWSIVQAQLFWLSGDSARARAFADTAVIAIDQSVKQTPASWQILLFRSLMLAFMGRRDEAIHDRDRGVAAASATGDQWGTIPYSHHVAARIDLALGDRDAAIAQVREVLSKPNFLSPGLLRIDPTWNPLRGDPRFEKLAHSDGK
jgi:tetratricopeptide (TPR) repeat protein